MVWDIIKYTFTSLATFPIIPFLITFFAYGIFQPERKKVIRLSMDVTTLFLIFNISALFNQLFNSSFGLFLILIVMLVAAGLLGNALYRKHGQLLWKKVLRVIWRLTFFISVLLHVVFMIIIILNLAFTVS